MAWLWLLSNIALASLLSVAHGLANGSPSILRTLNDDVQLPPFHRGGPSSYGYSREKRTASAFNPLGDELNTGVIRQYNFTIARGWIAPDGVNKSALLVNNVFPGPTLEANWGDTFQITVNNQISGPEEGTMLHWHGILHKQSQWYDGTPSVNSCPIAPGKSLTYTFKADQYGTSWWHSHYSAQLVDGLFGPMIIHGPNHVEYDVDIGPILLNDYYHKPYRTYIEMTSGIPFAVPFSDNNLINGKTDATFQFRSGRTHRLRLINSGAEGIQYYSIDDHHMTVYANDLVPVIPYRTDVVTLGPGQRTDVLVKGIGKPTDAYWMRSNMSTICSPASQPYARARIYYEDAKTDVMPTSNPTDYTIDKNCGNDPLAKTIPFYPLAPPANPATVETIKIVVGTNATGNTVFWMNGVSFRGDYNAPVLALAKLGNTTFPEPWNVYNFGSNSSVRLILINTSPLLAHPMHLHGHNFWVLAEGMGTWDGSITNPQNPQRRDVQMLWPAALDGPDQRTSNTPSYLVIEFNQDNPGVWPLHCHIAWHVSTGLYINVLSRPADVVKLDIPPTIAQTCRDWAAFTGQNVVDQIDSGL